MLYFAYGSNMSRVQMQERCPGHELIGAAVLKDHVLCFPRSSPVRNCGVAGIMPQRGSDLWGVVYRLTAGDLTALDRREGYDPAQPAHMNRYNRQVIRVRMGDAPVDCFAYLAQPEPGEHAPNAAYLAAIIAGAEENGLPPAYVAALRSRFGLESASTAPAA